MIPSMNSLKSVSRPTVFVYMIDMTNHPPPPPPPPPNTHTHTQLKQSRGRRQLQRRRMMISENWLPGHPEHTSGTFGEGETLHTTVKFPSTPSFELMSLSLFYELSMYYNIIITTLSCNHLVRSQRRQFSGWTPFKGKSPLPYYHSYHA